MEEMRNAHTVSDGKPEGKKPLGRSKCKWKDNFKMDLRDIGYEGVDRIKLAQDSVQCHTLVNIVKTFGFNKRQKIS
jgi:hypothetical protein